MNLKPRDKWEMVFSGDYKGSMYIDYFREGEEPQKIKSTEPFFIFNAKISRTFFDTIDFYIGGRNLGDFIQPEKHTDDAAFVYAPVYGRLFYGGLKIRM